MSVLSEKGSNLKNELLLWKLRLLLRKLRLLLRIVLCPSHLSVFHFFPALAQSLYCV